MVMSECHLLCQVPLWKPDLQMALREVDSVRCPAAS